MNLNKAIIIGRIIQYPRFLDSEERTPLLTFSVATNTIYHDKQLGRQEMAEFHNVKVRGKMASSLSKLLTKSMLVMVEGEYRCREWQDKGEKRREHYIHADRIQFHRPKVEQ